MLGTPLLELTPGPSRPFTKVTVLSSGFGRRCSGCAAGSGDDSALRYWCYARRRPNSGAILLIVLTAAPAAGASPHVGLAGLVVVLGVLFVVETRRYAALRAGS
jgi:hypothetical protein